VEPWPVMAGGAVAAAAGLAWLGWRAHEADWGRRTLTVVDGLVRLFCRRWHRLVADPVPLPESGPALLVANHVSGLDPVLMVAAVRRPLRFLIAREQYERRGLRWLFRAMGCIPVDRESRPQQAFREALAALARGEVVALFPGGRIQPPGRPPPPLKRGVARLAALSGAPVLAVHIGGVRGQGRVLGAVFLRARARLVFRGETRCRPGDEARCLARLEAWLTRG